MTETLETAEAGRAPEKRLFIKTYGCQMNVYDSERMADVLRPLGYATTDDAAQADFVILNTCHIREKAAEKVYSELGKLRELKEAKAETSGATMTIAVAGCVAQAEGEEIMRRQPAVDIVVGPQAYHQLPELLTRTARARGERIGADFAPDDKFDALPVARGTTGPTAFLTVQEGCDKFCTFCVVPYTRGAEVSRPVGQILAEAGRLAASGVREITLLGQNVNAWKAQGPDGREWGLGRLLSRLAEIPGIIADFRNASKRAIEAGFDGVEIHGAHGYLLDAFLRDGTNHRTDRYGGSVENRARLLTEVTAACAAEIGADRLGVRISPVSTAGDSKDSHPQALFNRVVDDLNPIGLAYLHVVEGDTGGARDNIAFDYAALRARFDGMWMVNNGYTRQMAMDAVSQGRANLVSFGRLFMANPDLVRRLFENAPLNALMAQETFYGGGAHGYTDYPFLDPKNANVVMVEPIAV